MNTRRSWAGAALIVSVLLVASCASTPTTRTDVIGTWKADNYHKKLSDVLIISLADEPGLRDKVESIVADRLEKRGLRAVASSDIMSPDKEINLRTVKAAMAGRRFDGVLVSRLLGVERSAVYVPPSPETSLDNLFNVPAPIAHEPGRIEHSSVVTLQIDLYDTASEHLVWSLKMQAVNPANVTDVVNDLADAVIHDLRIHGLI
jgi:hypothetical protein